MHLRPANLNELKSSLDEANRTRRQIASVDLAAFSQLLEHHPEDMTATVQGGMTLASVQSELRRRGQWLPIDPPHPDCLTIADLIVSNASGPRRFGYGTIRDYLLEIKVALADGRIIKSGGKVVKNVAGYDVMKLFVGSRNTLGVVVEATFKLKPIAASEQFLQKRLGSLDEAAGLLEAISNSILTPIVLDLHNAAATPADARHGQPVFLTLGFAGERDEVDYQLEEAKRLTISEPGSLDYENQFWRIETPLKSASVLPSDLIATLKQLANVPFLARAGNGWVWYRGGPDLPHPSLPLDLMRRIKDTFDPNHIFPELHL